MDPARATRLKEIATIAVKVEADTQVPAQLTIAQWALESEWGAKKVGNANVFGIKRASRHPMSVTVTTTEFYTVLQIRAWNSSHAGNPARMTGKASPDGSKFEVMIDDQFADYPSLEAAVRDYAWLLSHGAPYAQAWANYQRNKVLPQFINAVALVYSTSPSYANLVAQIAKEDAVIASITAAKG